MGSQSSIDPFLLMGSIDDKGVMACLPHLKDEAYGERLDAERY